jgi:predicted sugar kinase
VNKTQLDDSPTQVISVYPNPTENKTNVEMYVNESKATFHIKVVNLLGQIMTTDLKTFSKGLNKFEIDASNYAQGAYVISIVNKATSEAIDVKFVKQ